MNDYVRPRSLMEVVWPPSGLWRELTLILAGSLIIALSAQVRLPMWPVPVTGQTFGVLLVAALLGRRAVFSVLAYLMQGTSGLPVFAGGAAGAAQLFGPTGGYLAGFVLAAYVVGWLCERGWDRRAGSVVLVMVLGNLVIYSVGVLWLSRFVGWDQVLALGVIPFLPGDILKIVLAALLLPAGWKLLAR